MVADGDGWMGWSAELVSQCERLAQGTPLEAVLRSRYVSWASVIGLFVGGAVYFVRPELLLQTPRGSAAAAAAAAHQQLLEAEAEREQARGAGDAAPPPSAKKSTTARLCFNTTPAQMLAALKTCPAGGGVDQRDANGWTAIMWCAHWGEDEHVFALLESGADTSLTTTQPWFNMAAEYSEGSSALDIARFDVAEYYDSPTMLRIVGMLESAAEGTWSERREGFRRRLGRESSDEDEDEEDDDEPDASDT